MGLLKDLVGIAAPIAGTLIGGPLGGSIGGALGGLVSGSGQPKSTTATQQQKLDPRIEQMLFGSNGQQGLLSQYQGMLNTPRSAAAAGFAGANGDYLSHYGASDLGAARQAALGVMGGNGAPQAQQVGAGLNAYAVGNMVDAPSQNNIDLSGSYQNLLSGGDTSKLMSSLQAGNALAGAQFQQNQANLTDNLQRNILPGIRSNSVLAGQYGGSRQGVAEGLAVSDLTKQLNNSNTQFGLGATAANSSALAGAYENGQNRALSATQGLGAQQYGVASQNAQTKNQAEFMNVGNNYDLGKFNAGLNQQTNLANQGAQLSTNAQNNGAALGGAGLLSGLLGQAQGAVDANDNWSLNRAQGVNSLLAPYLGANRSTTDTQPLHSNPMGNAVAGAGLGSMFGNLGNGGTGTGPLDGIMKLFGAGPGVIG